MDKLTDHAQWQKLVKHHAKMKSRHLRDLFRDDPDRAEKFHIEDCGLFLDFSKNLITEKTLNKLVALAKAAGVEAARDRMFGEATTRMRETLDMDAVLQTAIREIGEALGIAEVEVRMGQSGNQESMAPAAHAGDDGREAAEEVAS